MSLNRPAIETERLLLRPFSTADLDDWAGSIFADPDVTRYLPKREIPPHQRTERALKYVQEHWARHGYGLWAVTEMIFVNGTHLFGLDLVNYAIPKEQFEVGSSRFVIITHENLDDCTRQ